MKKLITIAMVFLFILASGCLGNISNRKDDQIPKLNYVEDVFRGLTFIDIPKLPEDKKYWDLTFRAYSKNPGEGNERTEYIYLGIYNKNGEQVIHWQSIPYERYTNITVSLPKNPPYLVRAYMTSTGSIEMFGYFNKYERLINSSSKDPDVPTLGNPPYYIEENTFRYSVIVNSLDTSSETKFNVNKTTIFVADVNYEHTQGTTIGSWNVSVIDPSGRIIGSVEETLGDTNYYHGGYSCLQGEWTIKATLDYPSLQDNEWEVDIGVIYILPTIKELGFEFL